MEAGAQSRFRGLNPSQNAAWNPHGEAAGSCAFVARAGFPSESTSAALQENSTAQTLSRVAAASGFRRLLPALRPTWTAKRTHVRHPRPEAAFGRRPPKEDPLKRTALQAGLEGMKNLFCRHPLFRRACAFRLCGQASVPAVGALKTQRSALEELLAQGQALAAAQKAAASARTSFSAGRAAQSSLLLGAAAFVDEDAVGHSPWGKPDGKRKFFKSVATDRGCQTPIRSCAPHNPKAQPPTSITSSREKPGGCPQAAENLRRAPYRRVGCTGLEAAPVQALKLQAAEARASSGTFGIRA